MQGRPGQTSRRPADGTRPPAFTLIELLTVVAIIGLLVGMVVPTIQSIMETLIDAETRVRIQSLSAGAFMYRINATGNRYFPGQEYIAKIESGTTYKGAASAYLARCLFTDPNDPKGERFPVEAYAALEPGMVDRDGSQAKVAGTILDTVNPQMAILYYVSRRGMKGKVLGQFIHNDNKIYTDGNSYGSPVKTLDTELGSSTKPPRDGEFLLIGAGKDRLYFSSDDRRNY